MRVPFLPLVAPLFVAASLAAQAKEAVDFEKQIWPILEKRCVECHATAHATADGKTKKPKGGVTLDNKDALLASKKGKLVVAKKPDDSLLYSAITLPADDEDRMPPAKKGEPLSAEQTALIKKWIEGGADFGKWTGKKAEEAGKDKGTEKDKGKGDKPADGAKGTEKAGGKTSRVDPLPGLQRGMQALPAATLAAFANGPFRVASVGDESPLLTVGCVGQIDGIDDRALAALEPIAEHVAELDLARTKVGDAGCAVIAKMKRLVALDLHRAAFAEPVRHQGRRLRPRGARGPEAPREPVRVADRRQRVGDRAPARRHARAAHRDGARAAGADGRRRGRRPPPALSPARCRAPEAFAPGDAPPLAQFGDLALVAAAAAC